MKRLTHRTIQSVIEGFLEALQAEVKEEHTVYELHAVEEQRTGVKVRREGRGLIVMSAETFEEMREAAEMDLVPATAPDTIPAEWSR